MTATKTTMLNAENVRDLLHYDPETGVFTRLKTGKPTGRVSWCGYIEFDIWTHQYKAHRVAWLYMTGRWPTGNVDHKDGDRQNNRFSNLREATPTQNTFNAAPRTAKKSSLPRGVRQCHRSVSYQAEISKQGKKVYLGRYETPEEASEVYQLAAELLHGEFAYHLGAGANAKGN